jgi:hypothetical protein
MSDKNQTITNEEKRQVYAELKTRLKLALSKNFYFEAIMLEYAIIEDRTASVLFHAGVCQNSYDSNKKLTNKLNSIELQIDKGNPVISRKMDVALIMKIRKWKDERNDFVHNACIRPYDNDKLQLLAEQGNEIVRQLDNAARRVSTLADKLNKAQNQ